MWLPEIVLLLVLLLRLPGRRVSRLGPQVLQAVEVHRRPQWVALGREHRWVAELRIQIYAVAAAGAGRWAPPWAATGVAAGADVGAVAAAAAEGADATAWVAVVAVAAAAPAAVVAVAAVAAAGGSLCRRPPPDPAAPAAGDDAPAGGPGTRPPSVAPSGTAAAP